MRKIAKKIRNFLKLSLYQKSLFIEVFFSLLLAYILIQVRSQQWLTAQWGLLHQESPEELSQQEHRRLWQLTRLFHIFEVNLPERFNCRVHATAAKWMLNRRDFPSTVYVGFRKNPDTGNIEGHAWLRSGRVIVTGRQNFRTFQITSYYGEQSK